MDDISKASYVHQANLSKTADNTVEHSEIVPLKEEADLRRKFDVFLLPPLALMLVVLISV